MKPNPNEDSEETTEKRICVECNERPTISPRTPYCAKCMAARGNNKRREMAAEKGEAPSDPIPPDRPGGTLTINFGKYGHILKAVSKLAEEEMRPIDMHVIFILNKHLSGLKRPSEEAVAPSAMKTEA